MKKISLRALTALIIALSVLFAAGCTGSNSETVTTTDTTQSHSSAEDSSVVPESTPAHTDTEASVTVPDNTLNTHTQEVSTEQTSENLSQTAETSATSASAQTKPQKQEATSNNTPDTVEEIVALFNSSANRIKPEATKVVKNYEKRIVDEENLVVPAALESTAKSLISTFMKDDTEPIVYETKEDIKNEFLVPNQSYVSKLKAEDVAEATCVDNGTQYIIYIKAKDEKNPKTGTGVGSVFDIIEASEVSEKVSFVESFSTNYYNCEVRATVDKASGRVTHINYNVPLVLDMTVNLFGTHSGSVGLTFEKDYTITY